jgi:hypothetical protein
MKGFVIARMPPYKKKKSSYERLRDSQNSIVKDEELVKGLCDIQRLCESLNPTVKGIPTERHETTRSCGLNPTVKGIPTERPETTSCGLNPTVKGIPTERLETTISCSLSFRHDN